MRLLSSSLSVAPLVSRHVPFAEWPEAYRFIDTHGPSIMKVMIDL